MGSPCAKYDPSLPFQQGAKYLQLPFTFHFHNLLKLKHWTTLKHWSLPLTLTSPFQLIMFTTEAFGYHEKRGPVNSELSALGKIWDPLSHPRSSSRWWNPSGSRKVCGPCGSCYPRALVEASGAPRQLQSPGKRDVVPAQADLHMPAPGSHTNWGKRGCLIQSELLGAYSGESFLSWLPIPSQERRHCIGRWVHAESSI